MMLISELGFANAIAYYMKLAYNNWHKEIVHDDAHPK